MAAMGSHGSKNIDDYFNLVQQDLEIRFKKSRQQNTDSEAKGCCC
jgi:hypothetical protein